MSFEYSSCSHSFPSLFFPFIHSFIYYYASFGRQQQIAYEKLCQHVSKLEDVRESEINLMRHRINDLTVKLTKTEKTLRQTHHRLTKSQERNSRLRKASSEETITSNGSLSSQTVYPINSTKTTDNNQEESSTKCKSSAENLTTETSSFMPELCVVMESSHNEVVLTRLRDLSTSLRKISDSLNSTCDTNKCVHRSSSSTRVSEATKM